MDSSGSSRFFSCGKKGSISHPSTRKARSRGFSLPEILVILGIVGLLSALGFNYFSRARAAAYQAQCDLNFKSLLVGMNQFRADLGTMPLDITELSDAGYVKNPSALRCASHPLETENYDDFYIARNNRDMADRPLVVCPFHEKASGHGLQAYSNMQTHHHALLPAIIRSASNATVETPGEEPRMAKKGVEVYGGDVLRTGNSGSATLIFADGSASTLSRNSSLLMLQTFIPRPAPYYTLVRHLQGDITYDVNDGSHFEVATPSSVVGAYGTRFRIIIDATGEGDVWALHNSIYVSGPEDFAVLTSNTPNSARHLPRKRRRHGNGNGNNGNGNGNGGGNGNNGGNNGGGNNGGGNGGNNGGNGNGNGNNGNGNGGNPNRF